MLQYFRSALAITVLVFMTVFAIQNLSAVDVSFLIWSASMPKFVVVMGTYLLGMLTGWGMIDLVKKLFKKKNATKSTVKSSSSNAAAET